MDHSKRTKLSALNPPIYLDYLATTPICPEATEVMIDMLQNQSNPEGCWGNAGSDQHIFGRKAKASLEKARKQVADLLNCVPAEICFESGSTETINHALRGALMIRASSGRNHVVLSEIEHPAVMATVLNVAKDSHTLVRPDCLGVVRAVDIAAACIKGKTALVTIMLANNEIGSVMNLREITQAVKAIDDAIFVHSDASQAVGKIVVDVKAMGVDFLTLAGHKLYAPKGIGALYIRSGILLPSIITGAGHESGRRAGTENVLLAAALGAACASAMETCLTRADNTRELRDQLFELIASTNYIQRNGSDRESERLPGALSVRFGSGIRGFDVASKAGELGLAFSAGAACHTGEVKASKVLKAIGLSDDEAIGTVRLSIGRFTTAEVRNAHNNVSSLPSRCV
jgi:cysteine desulfurase